MSIAENTAAALAAIDGLAADKEALRQAIIAQGVNVPEGALLEDYAGFVDAIQGTSPDTLVVPITRKTYSITRGSVGIDTGGVITVDQKTFSVTLGDVGVTLFLGAPIVTGVLPAQTYDQNSGTKTVDAASVVSVPGDPTLSTITWSVTGTGATISSSGVVSITTTTVRINSQVTVTAANNFGSVQIPFVVTVQVQSGVTSVNIFRSAYASDAAYATAYKAAIDSALNGSGSFSGISSGDTRRVNLDGVVSVPFELGNDTTKTPVSGRVEIVGSGMATCRFLAVGHVIHGGTSTKNVDVLIDEMDIGLGNVGSSVPSDLTSNILVIGGKYKTIEFGRDVGFNRYSMSVGGATNYDTRDMRLFFRAVVLTGVTQAEYNDITAPGEYLTGTWGSTRVEIKEWLGGDSCKLWVNGNDHRTNTAWNGSAWVDVDVSGTALWSSATLRMTSGQVVNWSGGNGTVSSYVRGAGVPPSFSQTDKPDIDNFIFRGLMYNAGEGRFAANDLVQISAVVDGLGCGDYFKLRANVNNQLPDVFRVYRTCIRYSMPGQPINNAHADISQWFDGSFVADTTKVEWSDSILCHGYGTYLGQRVQVLGAWGSAVSLTCAPGSFIRNCIVDANGGGNWTQANWGRNIAFSKLTAISSDLVTFEGSDPNLGAISVDNSCSITDSFVTRVSGSPSTSNMVEIGGASGGGYTTYFPNWSEGYDLPGEIIGILTPAPAHSTKGPVNQSGQFVGFDGTVLWTSAGAPGGSPPILQSPIADQTFEKDGGSVTIDLGTVFTNATSYAVSGTTAASISGSTLTLSDAAEIVATVTVTASNGGGFIADSFLLTVTAVSDWSVDITAIDATDATVAYSGTTTPPAPTVGLVTPTTIELTGAGTVIAVKSGGSGTFGTDYTGSSPDVIAHGANASSDIVAVHGEYVDVVVPPVAVVGGISTQTLTAGTGDVTVATASAFALATGSTATYALASALTGYSINSSSGVVTVDTNTAGDETVTVTATSGSTTVQVSFSVILQSAAANPMISLTNTWVPGTDWSVPGGEDRNTALDLASTADALRFALIGLTAAEHPKGVPLKMSARVSAVANQTGTAILRFRAQRFDTDGVTVTGAKNVGSDIDATALNVNDVIEWTWDNDHSSADYGAEWGIELTSTGPHNGIEVSLRDITLVNLDEV